jgi:predicted nucleotidyltransferase
MNPSDEPDLQNLLKSTLRDHGGVRLAILFGSRTTGAARADSDVDVAAQMAAPLSAEERIALIEALAAATGLPVDLVDLKQVGEPLLGQILKNGIRLIGSDADYAALLTRHLFDAADFLPYRNRILAERRRAWIGR